MGQRPETEKQSTGLCQEELMVLQRFRAEAGGWGCITLSFDLTGAAAKALPHPVGDLLYAAVKRQKVSGIN